MINLVLSSHKINDAQICPRYYYYRHELLKAPLKDPDYYEEGRIMHIPLMYHYKARLLEKEPNYELIFELTRNFAIQNTSIKAERVEEIIKDFIMYKDFYGTKGEDWRVLGVEEPFAKELYSDDNIRIVVTGTNDLRIQTKGPMMIADHKYESQFRSKGERDNQPLTYCWAYKIRDFMFNRIGKQKSYDPDKRLRRDVLCFGEHQIEEWKDNTISTALDLVRANETGVWPGRFSGCQIHGRKCTFYDICNTTPSNRQYKMETFFRDAPPYDEKFMER